MTEEQSRILEKVKKLMALATNNPEANEAKTAMEVAGKLLAQYDLSMEMVREGQKENRFSTQEVPIFIDRNKHWEGQLCTILAEVFNCKVFRWVGKDTKYSWCFVGEPHNVEICIWYLKYLRLQISKKAEERYNKSRDRESYALGMISTLAKRLREMNQSRKESMTENSKAIALRTSKELDNFFAQMRYDLGLVTRKSNRRYDSNALENGVKDGKNLSLNRPVKGGTVGGLTALD